MKVVFITEQQCIAVEFEEAAVIFILCDEEIESICGTEVVNLNDLNIYKNIEKNISLSFQYFDNKLVGFITLDNWVAEIDHNFKSITPKPDLLIIVGDCDVDMNIFDQAVEKLNIPIVFLNKYNEEYLVVGAAHEIEEGYFCMDI